MKRLTKPDVEIISNGIVENWKASFGLKNIKAVSIAVRKKVIVWVKENKRGRKKIVQTL